MLVKEKCDICHMKTLMLARRQYSKPVFHNSAATVTLGSNRQERFVCGVFHLFCRSHSNILKDNQNSADPKLIDKSEETKLKYINDERSVNKFFYIMFFPYELSMFSSTSLNQLCLCRIKGTHKTW